MSSYDICEKAIDVGADKILIIDRWKGRPGRMRFFEARKKLSQIPPQLYIRGVKLRRDFKTKRRFPYEVYIEAPRNIKFQKLSEVFSRFFELPIIESNMTDKPQRFIVMRFSSDPNGTTRISFYLMPKNVEVGPRIRISHAVWEI